jgi:hypothetical protein
VGEETLARSSIEGTLAMLVNGGALQDEIARLALEAGKPVMGSSANMTGQGSYLSIKGSSIDRYMLTLLPFALVGTKSLVEDIEPEILNAVDLVINYGRQKYNTPRSVLSAEGIEHSLRHLLTYLPFALAEHLQR